MSILKHLFGGKKEENQPESQTRSESPSYYDYSREEVVDDTDPQLILPTPGPRQPSVPRRAPNRGKPVRRSPSVKRFTEMDKDVKCREQDALIKMLKDRIKELESGIAACVGNDLEEICKSYVEKSPQTAISNKAIRNNKLYKDLEKEVQKFKSLYNQERVRASNLKRENDDLQKEKPKRTNQAEPVVKVQSQMSDKEICEKALQLFNSVRGADNQRFRAVRAHFTDFINELQ